MTNNKSRHFYQAVLSPLGVAVIATLCLWVWNSQPMDAQSSTIRYVAVTGVDSGTCPITSPCRTIQFALTKASSNNEIRIAASGVTPYQGTVIISKNITLRGGYTVADWNTSNPIVNETKIDALQQGRVIEVTGGFSVTIRGLHITNGKTSGQNGAGVFNSGTSANRLTLLDNYIYNNVAQGTDLAGGGVAANSGGSITIKNNHIYNNVVQGMGGGIAILTGTAAAILIEGNTIYQNQATNAGGGIYTIGSSASNNITVQNNVIYGNSTTQAAAVSGGGGLFFQNSAGTIKLSYNTIYGNSSVTAGGGIYVGSQPATTVSMIDSLVVANTATTNGGLHVEAGANFTSSFSDIYSNNPTNDNATTGTSNVTTAPATSQFVNEAGGDFHLKSGVRAIDSGTNVVGILTDIEGNPRPFANGYDRGAYEYSVASTCFAQVSSSQVVTTTIQGAISLAGANDTIKIAGVCTGVEGALHDGSKQVVYINKNNLTLRGGYSNGDWTNPTHGPTLVDAAKGGRVIYVDNAVTQVTLENLQVVNGGGAGDGAGLYLAGSGKATLQNNVFYNNEATRGGAVYVGGSRALSMTHNTLYQNIAQKGGAVFADGTAKVTLQNSIVANSTGNGVEAAAANQITLGYNAFNGNTPASYGANTAAATTDMEANPGLTNPTSKDFHLDFNTSNVINLADPNSTLAVDFDNDARPQPLGGRKDIGADESLFYLALDLPAATNSPILAGSVQGATVSFKHTIKSNSKTPTGKATFNITLSNNNGWPATLSGITSPVDLSDGETRTFEVVVTVGTLSSGVDNRTTVTAVAAANAAVTQTQTDVVAGILAELAPSYDKSDRPGEILTYTHILTNNGSTADTFNIELISQGAWGTLVIPAPSTATMPSLIVGPNSSKQIIVQVQIGKSAAAGVQDVMTVKATSQSTGIAVTVVDTTTAQATIGTRYVSTVLSDNSNNNCTQRTIPCKTIAYALTQAASGDEIRVAQGVYKDGDLLINQFVSLRGGYSANFATQTLNPGNTIIDAAQQGTTDLRRGLRIQNVPAVFQPLIQGFLIRNTGAVGAGGGGIFIEGTSSPTVTNMVIENSTAANGGGIFIDSNGGKPVLRNIAISSTTATGRGGGIYVLRGVVSMEAITITGATANQEGGGIYNLQGTVTMSRSLINNGQATIGGGVYNAQGVLNLWNNFLTNNNATVGDGGGVFNAIGTLNVWNNTLSGNHATGRGGAIYHNNGPLQVVNTIMANGTAATVGGLFYNGSGTVNTNLYFGNSNGNSNVPIDAKSLIDVDPLFKTGDTHLSAGSPAIDKGNPTTFLVADFDNELRPKDQTFDIGADESGSCVVTVGKTIYGSPQEAIDDAPPGSKILISGVCRGTHLLGGGGGSCTGQFLQTVVITKDLILEGVNGTLDAGKQGRTITVIGPATLKLTNLNLVNGLTDKGGAIYNCNGTVNIDGGSIYDNQAAIGGAIYNHGGGSVVFGLSGEDYVTLKKGTVMTNNVATQSGGAVYNLGLFYSRVASITNNSAASGGAFYNEPGGRLWLENTLLVTNTAADGGAVYNLGALTSTNVMVVNNVASGNGAGFYNRSLTFTVRHNTFYNNQGGGIYNNAATNDPIINSNLFLGGLNNVGIINAGATPQADYNGFSESSSSVTGPHDVFNMVVPFGSLSPNNPKYLRLVEGSAAEDKGDPDSPITVDIDNKPRPANAAPDLGASELSECYVQINGVKPTYGSVQYALNLSKPGDELRVAGTCSGVNSLGDSGVKQTVFITTNIKIRGGFTPTNFVIADLKKYTTTIDANGLGRLFYITNSAVVSIANMHLTGGAAVNGAAVYNGNGNVILDGNHIFGNDATQNGAAFYQAGGSLAVWNNAIYKNTAANGAGGYSNALSATVWHNTFYQNNANQGAGFYTTKVADVRNNIFLGDKGSSVLFSEVALPIDYNDIFGQTGTAYGGSATAGSHAFNVNPELENPAVLDFTLQDFSLMVDAGDPTMSLTHDYEGHLRPGNQSFDLGRDEIPGCQARLVRTNTIYGNIQVAIDNSKADDVIQVVAQECNGVHGYDVGGGKIVKQTVHVDHSLSLLGGFDEKFTKQITTPTVINPKKLGRALLVVGSGKVTIENFSLQNGDANGLGGGPGGADAGGALLYLATGEVLISGTQFVSSTAAFGAGLYNDGSGLTVRNGEVTNNVATVGGAGVFNGNAAGLKLYHTEISFNKSPDGAGFYNNTGTSVVDFGTRLHHNEASNHGGAIYNQDGALQIWNTLLYQNKAVNGAAIYLANGAGQVYHNTLHGNVAANQGGGLFVAGGAPLIKNNIFSSHQAAGGGSAIYGATGTLGHNNYFGNGGTAVAGGLSQEATALTVNPLFIDAVAENFSLVSTSPLINVGEDLPVFHDMDDPTDPRPINSAPDIGADEYNACLIKLARTGQIYGQINRALLEVIDGDKLLVAEGTCQENVTVQKNVTIEGGWPKNFVMFPNTINTYRTTFIDANGKGRPMLVDNTSLVTLSYLILQNGNTTENGGGLLSRATRLNLNVCTIISNTTTQKGGGIYIDSGEAIFAYVSAMGNRAGISGGGLGIGANGKLFMSASDVFSNQAQSGGGIYNEGGLEITNAAVDNNLATVGHGGGIYVASGTAVNLTNLALLQNVSELNGGGLYFAGSSSEIQHATIYGNSSKSGQGGGVYNESGNALLINASIIEHNRASSGGTGVQGAAQINNTMRWDNSYSGVTEGVGNREEDPLIKVNGSFLSIIADSPAIDAVPILASPTGFDVFGIGRPKMCNKDMGREEFRPYREMFWGLTKSVQAASATQAVTYTFMLTNASRNLTNNFPYDLLFADQIGTGYTETINLVLTSTKNWGRIVGVSVATKTEAINITADGRQAKFNLQSGQGAIITVAIIIPNGAKASIDNQKDSFDYVQLFANPQHWNRYGPPESCVTLTGDDKDLPWPSSIGTTRVIPSYDFVLAPPQHGFALAGEKITYTHYITNLGNSVDSYLLFPKPGYYASAEIIPNSVTLKPGESRKFIMVVSINGEAANGLLDHTSAIAQVVLPVGSVPIQGEVVDETDIGYRNGTRYVLFGEGRDSLVNEKEGAVDPETVDLLDNNCTKPLIAPCATLEQALTQASDGDVIKIAAGSYSRTLVISKSVTIQGGNNSNNWDLVPPPHLTFTTFIAPLQGRAVQVMPGQTVTLDRLVIQDGNATGLGGGANNEDVGGNIFNEGDSLTLSTNRIFGGQAALGAGLYSRDGDVILRNNLFHDNTGGAVYLQAGKGTFENNDFFRNSATTGAAIRVDSGVALLARNNILAQNGANSIMAATGTLDYNLYHGGDSVSGGAATGANNVTGDPLFIGANDSPPNLKLPETSPAVDKGDPLTNIGLMPLDYANSPRRSGLTNRIDVGAYEFFVPPLFEFSPDYDVVVPLGEVRVLTHTLTNLTNSSDTYNFTSSSSQPWVVVDTTPKTLGPNETTSVLATVSVPADAPLGTTNLTVITTTSSANGQALVFVIDTIAAGVVPINLTVDGPLNGQLNVPYRFTATAGPSSVAQPITYTWEATGQAMVIHGSGSLTDMVDFTWDSVGTKQITITADNGQTIAVVKYLVNIQAGAIIPLSAQVSGATAGLINLSYDFVATVNPEAITPLTYIWTANNQTITHTVNGLTDTVSFSWPTAGNQTVSVSVNNVEGTAVASYVMIITNEPQPPSEVLIAGPTAAVFGRDMLFTASVSPFTTTQPITYVWQASGLLSQTIVVGSGLEGNVIFNWGALTGTQTVTVTVSNGSGVEVQDTHEIFLSETAVPPLAVQLSGPQTGLLNTSYRFTATVSPDMTSQPLSFRWSATDNLGVVQSNNLIDSVAFRWSTAGLKTITVVAQNEAGIVTTTYQIVVGTVILPQAPTQVEIIGATAGLINQPYTFQANVLPITATQPLLYSWQVTGNPTIQSSDNNVIYTWATPGTYQVIVTVSNGQGSTSQTFTVIITAEPLPPLAVKIKGVTAGLLNNSYIFSATTSPITTTQLLTYMWQATGNPTMARQQGNLTNINQLLQNAVSFRWTTPGIQVITVTVMNGAGSATAVYSVSMTFDPVAPTSISVTGPNTGETGRNYAFTATVAGDLTTQPLTYQWEATGLATQQQVNNLQDVVMFNWTVAGMKLLTVTASNGAGQVVGTYTINLKLGNTTTYLPILLKNQASLPTATATVPSGSTATATATVPSGNTPTATATVPSGGTPTATATVPSGSTATATATVPSGSTATATVPSVNTPTATVPSGSTPTATATPDRPPLLLPDLVIDSFTIDDLGSGQYEVNVVIRNQAAYAVPVGNNFYLGVYVDDVTVDPPIFWGLQGAWFTAGASRSFSQQFTAAEVGSGAHTFFVWVDPYNVVSESDETNNMQQQGGVVINSINGESREAPSRSSSGPLPTPTVEQ